MVLLTGFLGAGKTTLLNRILAESHEVRTAVLVNDFGEVSIDASLVVDVRGDTIVMANGCICCSVRGDLLGALERLLKVPSEQRVERVVIEASGIADPRALLMTFVALDKASSVALHSMLAIVDASELSELNPRDLSLARDQLDQSDLVVINKVDLATPEQLDYCRAEVNRFAPHCPKIETAGAAIPLQLLLDLEPHPHGPSSRSGGVRSDTPLEPSAAQNHGFSSLTLRYDRPLSLPALRELCVALPEGLYRAKGVLWLAELPTHRVILQVVGSRARVDRGEAWAGAKPESQIVLIGREGEFDQQKVRQSFNACIAREAAPAAQRSTRVRELLSQWWRRGAS